MLIAYPALKVKKATFATPLFTATLGGITGGLLGDYTASEASAKKRRNRAILGALLGISVGGAAGAGLQHLTLSDDNRNKKWEQDNEMKNYMSYLKPHWEKLQSIYQQNPNATLNDPQVAEVLSALSLAPH
jgi:hypothetical protein